MTVIIFGSTGFVGQELIRLALGRGYNVKAYGRHVLEKVAEQEHLELIKGSVFDEVDIRKALMGCDAVLSALGGAIDGNDVTRSLGMKKIVTEMTHLGLLRIVAIGGQGVLLDADGKNIFEGKDFPEQFKPVSKEHFKAFETLSHSKLEWTFVCPTMITANEPTGKYNVSKNVPAEGIGNIGAGDLANFMIDEITKKGYLNTRVGISN